MNNAILPLHVLSFLCHLPTPRSDRSRLAELLPAWLEQLPPAGTDYLLTERQWRRWRLLHTYWLEQGPRLIAHGLRRGLLSAEVESELARLGPILTPPLHPQWLATESAACTALFITPFPWGESHGECQVLELRQVKYLDRFPPLHLSARVADVAILSAGNLALEALSHWLASRLALAEDFPLWAEAAFPDTVRLVDESASLAFVAGAMQHIFGYETQASAFSGIVRRDSGRIETVQGFDLPYGKLEAAFDAGVRLLFLPHGTPLTALPQAGILLQKQADHYLYFLADQPEDSLEIHLLHDLEDLYRAAFSAQNPQRAQARLESLPLQLHNPLVAMPALVHWQRFCARLEARLPEALQPALARLGRAYQQASELAQAGLDADWQAVLDALQGFLHAVVLLLANVLASLALVRDQGQQKQALLARLQALQTESISGFLALLTDEQLTAGLAGSLQVSLASLAGFARSVLLNAANLPLGVEPGALWKDIRFLLSSPLLDTLFEALQLVTEDEILFTTAGNTRAIAAQPVATRLCLRLEGRTWPLPLCELQGQEVWVYAGMAQQEPVYRALAAGQQRVCPGACPYLPARVLEVRRSFAPVHRQQGRQLFYGQEALRVTVSLCNLTYLSLESVACREILPTGLVSQEALHWQGTLAPRQQIQFEYLLQPPAPGTYLLADPELSYCLPSPYAQLPIQPAVLPEIELVVESHSRPLLEIRRQLPEAALTRQRFEMLLELENQSSQPAEELCWQTSWLPAGTAWRQISQLALPERLEPYQTWQQAVTFEAVFPGLMAWPALKLAYRGPLVQTSEASEASEPVPLQIAGTPAQTMPVHFQRELPPTARNQAQTWLDACLREPSLQGILIWGEKGLGKRQLLQTWQPLSLVCELEGDAFLSLPFQATRRLLGQLLAAAASRRLPGGLEAELDWLEAFVRNRLAMDAENDSQFKSRLFQACLRLLDALTLAEPLLLRIYSVELLDPASLELLRFLLLNQARLVLALTSQQPDLPGHLADLPLKILALPRLDVTEVQACLDTLFAPHCLPAGLAADLWVRTQGMPLYLQEYLAGLVESGQLLPQAEAWRLKTDLAELPMPEKLERLILKDLQGLPGELLAWSSVLGQGFERVDLQALAPQAEVDVFLAQAVAKGLLLAEEPGRFVFTHPLFHELLYKQAQAQGLVEKLHASAARYFELRGADPQLVAVHWSKAGDQEQTLDYCLRLGEQALRQGAYEAAGKWLPQAEALLQKRPEQKSLCLRLSRCLGELYRFTDNQERAREAYRLSLRLAGECASLTDQAWAWLGLGALTQQSEARHCLEQGHALALQLQDPDLLYQACLQLGVHLAEAGSYTEGQPYLDQALEHSPPASVKQAEVLEIMGYESIKAGRTQQAEACLLRAKILFETHQQWQGLASVYNRLGACCFYQQEWQRARHYFGESRKYCQQTGNQLKLAQVNHNLGLLAEALRDYAGAETIFLENLKLASHLNDLRIQGFAWNQLGSVRLKLRQSAAACEALQQAAELLEQATDQRGMAYVQMNQGLLALLEGDPVLAEQDLLRAQTVFAEMGDIMGQDQVTLRLGHVAWLKGHVAKAETLYRQCLTTREALDRRQEDGLERVYHALGLVAFAQADWSGAEKWLKQAELLLEKRREISHYAMACHNLMRLYQQTGRLDQAVNYKQKRDVLIGIDRYEISRELYHSSSLHPMLD